MHPPVARDARAVEALRVLLAARSRGRPAWRGWGCYAPTVHVTQIEVNQFK